jgi:hypothetical protein
MRAGAAAHCLTLLPSRALPHRDRIARKRGPVLDRNFKF